jgi:hypothetical protein
MAICRCLTTIPKRVSHLPSPVREQYPAHVHLQLVNGVLFSQGTRIVHERGNRTWVCGRAPGSKRVDSADPPSSLLDIDAAQHSFDFAIGELSLPGFPASLLPRPSSLLHTFQP